MSNNTALARAAASLDQEVKNAHIDIFTDKAPYEIHWRDIIVKVDFGTPYARCRATLNKLIKANKALGVRENQVALFEEGDDD